MTDEKRRSDCSGQVLGGEEPKIAVDDATQVGYVRPSTWLTDRTRPALLISRVHPAPVRVDRDGYNADLLFVGDLRDCTDGLWRASLESRRLH